MEKEKKKAKRVHFPILLGAFGGLINKLNMTWH